MIIKIFISISSNTTQALAAHFDFTSFLSRPFFFFLVLGRSFFYTQGVLVEIIFTGPMILILMKVTIIILVFFGLFGELYKIFRDLNKTVTTTLALRYIFCIISSPHVFFLNSYLIKFMLVGIKGNVLLTMLNNNLDFTRS